MMKSFILKKSQDAKSATITLIKQQKSSYPALRPACLLGQLKLASHHHLSSAFLFVVVVFFLFIISFGLQYIYLWIYNIYIYMIKQHKIS